MARGRFITLEGGEGCGKSTQAELLAQALEARGLPVLLTREPGGTPGAEKIRELLLYGQEYKWDAASALLLFMAARYDHVKKVIQPALESGAWVVCDRFLDSTVIYQGVGFGLGMEYVRRLYRMVLGNFQPDITLVLDIDPEEGLARAKRVTGVDKEDAFEGLDMHIHRAFRVGFRALAERNPSRCLLIDAFQSPDQLHEHIMAVIRQRFDNECHPERVLIAH